MCLFSIVYRILPNCPLLILSNRDEHRRRPTQHPQLQIVGSSPVNWLGGRDLVAGGTWLGLNQFGLIISVTNRPKQNLPARVRSRGLFCRDLLTSRSVDEAVAAAEREIVRHQFDGFNLLLISDSQCTIIEAGDTERKLSLNPGIHSIANQDLDDLHDARVERAQRELQRKIGSMKNRASQLAVAREICSLPAEGSSPGICLTEPEWGTVSSTIIALPNDRQEAIYLHSPGPPSTTAYDDYSPQARQLLHQAIEERDAP